VALELLTRPSLLYLDEPTSGLDAGLDKSVMQSLRALADDGRTVIVVTHSVAQLYLCDFVLVLAPGGHVAYFGPPAGALSYFGKSDFPDVFTELDGAPGADAGARFRASGLYVPGSVTAPSARQAPPDLPSMRQQSVPAQLATLVRRTVYVIKSDRPYLFLIIAFPFLLGLVPRAIPAPGGLGGIPGGVNIDAPKVMLVMIICASLMGTANAIREIVKERSIYRRERMIGLSTAAYLGSKVVILTFVTAIQSAIFVSISLLGRVPPKAALLGSPLLEVWLAVTVTAVASAMIGLVISASVNNTDKTMPLLVLATMAQLVLCGGLVPVAGRPVLEQLSWLAPARWGFAAFASTVDLDVVSENVVSNVSDPLWAHQGTTWLTDLLPGLVVALGAVVLCLVQLRRADPRPTRRSNPEPAGNSAPAANRMAAE
jgi:energy-coupling factor transporter ATP-binding protein EcfA2